MFNALLEVAFVNFSLNNYIMTTFIKLHCVPDKTFHKVVWQRI